jgi:flagellin
MKIQNQALISSTVNRYTKTETQLNKTLEKLTSGSKLNKASDNAAGLAISETMKAQIRGLAQAQRNMQDGLSVLQATNEGLNNVNDLIQRARELSIAGATGTLTLEDRQASQLELEQLLEGVEDTAQKLEFNTKKILGENAPLILMVGANPQQKISIDLFDVSTKALGIEELSLVNPDNANIAINKLDMAIERIGSHLTKVGSHSEAIEHHMSNALLFETNLTTSVSLLQDADMAKELMAFISLNIREKGNQMLVSEVNRNTKDILKLI